MASAFAGAASRRFAFGAEVVAEGVHFRVWADRRRRVEVALEDGRFVSLHAEGEGWHSGVVAGLRDGARYRFRLDRGDSFPDPASRFQPEGPHGPSQVVDPTRFAWTDAAWPGPELDGTVLYELHVGTFTPEGTWRAAAEKLPHLVDLGVTCIEMMPVAEFAGGFGWGYDGVDWFAPYHHYGTPDDLRTFVDRAHGLGLAVILDVVYNHFGPDGNYTAQFSGGWETDRYHNDWGKALDFETSPQVRQFVIANACYWVTEFHFDGLRLDATQDIRDTSEPHICAELVAAARASAWPRRLLFVAENEPQQPHLVRPQQQGGWNLDLAWNDDYHHSAFVALTGRREAYFVDYAGTPQELISACRWGYLFQGQFYAWQQKPRGRPGRDIQPRRYVHFLENHDQIANLGRGWRIWRTTAPCLHRALTALTLLGAQTPMLFHGQEFAASAPFHYFADHTPGLAAQVESGRLQFLAQFSRLALPSFRPLVPSPHEPETFRHCKLDWSEVGLHAEAMSLHRDLLRLRREDLAFRAQLRVEGAVLTERAFVLRFHTGVADEDETDRLLVINLGEDVHLPIAPEPLLAPPVSMRWRVLWSSEDVRYGGDGTPEPDTGRGWWLPARAAVVLRPGPLPSDEPQRRPDGSARPDSADRPDRQGAP